VRTDGSRNSGFQKRIFQFFFANSGRITKKAWMDANRERYQDVYRRHRALCEERTPVILIAFTVRIHPRLFVLFAAEFAKRIEYSFFLKPLLRLPSVLTCLQRKQSNAFPIAVNSLCFPAAANLRLRFASIYSEDGGMATSTTLSISFFCRIFALRCAWIFYAAFRRADRKTRKSPGSRKT